MWRGVNVCVWEREGVWGFGRGGGRGCFWRGRELGGGVEVWREGVNV